MLCINYWSCTSFYFRANIESSYGQQVAKLREQYTQEDKELIKEALGVKDLISSSQKSEPLALAQKILIKEEAIFRKFNH